MQNRNFGLENKCPVHQQSRTNKNPPAPTSYPSTGLKNARNLIPYRKNQEVKPA